MKRVLLLPFLRISSGHHQTADSVIAVLQAIDRAIDFHKVDLLSYSYGKMESIVSSSYLKWIHLAPSTYNWLYQKSAYINNKPSKRYRTYELLFLHWMKMLIQEQKPDLIICTHALPSYILSCLKERETVPTPVVNIYTDFFVNRIWGSEAIDYHFVPDHTIKDSLTHKGVGASQIYVTGIPIHPVFTKNTKIEKRKKTDWNVLITGGSLGTGEIKQFIKKLTGRSSIQYNVLCGKNARLYDFINRLENPSITPLRYIESREEMNALYEKADAIITKPGGVTISECVRKQIPIFIYHALPGQEEINLTHLKGLGLVFHLKGWKKAASIENQIRHELGKLNQKNDYSDNLLQYHQSLDCELSSTFLEIISKLEP
jgi:processive 1,2-diacylglycerol beta-glucosyltransferase